MANSFQNKGGLLKKQVKYFSKRKEKGTTVYCTYDKNGNKHYSHKQQMIPSSL